MKQTEESLKRYPQIKRLQKSNLKYFRKIQQNLNEITFLTLIWVWEGVILPPVGFHLITQKRLKL